MPLQKSSKFMIAAVSVACISVISCSLASTASATEIIFKKELAEDFCKEEWNKRGILDTRMFDYCMKEQKDGYAKALELFNKYSSIEPVPFINDVVASALNKWANREYQMNMVAFEIEQQGEAYLNIAYEVNRGNIGEQTLEHCKSEWITANEPDWNMVEFCTKEKR